MLGAFAVNGWLNVIHIALGAIGLLVAGFAARSYSLWLGLLLVVLAAWGFVIGSGDAILGFIPCNFGDNILHLVLGALGARRRGGDAAARVGGIDRRHAPGRVDRVRRRSPTLKRDRHHSPG